MIFALLVIINGTIDPLHESLAPWQTVLCQDDNFSHLNEKRSLENVTASRLKSSDKTKLMTPQQSFSTDAFYYNFDLRNLLWTQGILQGINRE